MPFKILSPMGVVTILTDNPQGGLSPLDDYITNTLTPMLHYKFDEPSGDLINYGSETGADGTVSGATQAQTGQLGAGEAYSFDGVDDVVTVANANIPNAKALTTQRFAALINPTTLGEGNIGKVWSYTTAYNAGMLSLDRFLVSIDCATTDAQAITNSSQIQNLIGAWGWVFGDYDDANALGLGRRIRLWKGIGGTLTQLTLATNTAGVGAVVAPSAAYSIGNLSNLSGTFDGLVDVLLHDGGLWTTDEMQQLIDLAEV